MVSPSRASSNLRSKLGMMKVLLSMPPVLTSSALSMLTVKVEPQLLDTAGIALVSWLLELLQFLIVELLELLLELLELLDLSLELLELLLEV